MKKLMPVFLARTLCSVSAAVFLFACNKDNPASEPAVSQGPYSVEIDPVPTGSTGTCTYFSFEKNSQIALTNEQAASDLNWDIAFLGLSARTNGGISGSGKGRVFRTDTENFDKIVSAAPYIGLPNLWEADRRLSTMDISRMPPPTVTLGLNPLLVAGGWYAYGEGMPPSISMDKNVYILQTAKGRYVKLQFVDTKGKDGKLGKVRFRYDFIAETGENAGLEAAVREGGKVISTEGKLAELLPEKDAAELLYLTIEKKTVNQEDLSYIRNKMPKLQELNLANATLSLTDSDYGFKDNRTLRKLILPSNLTAIGFGHVAYTNIEEVVIPGDKLTRVGEGAFAFSTKLARLKLPASVEYIEKDAFRTAKGLAYLEIPEKVMLVPEFCFYECSALQAIVFKGKVKTLREGAFSACAALTSITMMHPEPPAFEKWPFMGWANWENADKTPRVVVRIPKGSLSAYMTVWGFNPETEKGFFYEF